MREVLIDRLEDWGLFTGQPRGLYPWLGSVFPGGGLGAGAGVQQARRRRRLAQRVRRLLRQRVLARRGQRGAAVVRAEPRPGVAVGPLPRCSGREVPRHRERHAQRRSQRLRLHAGDWRCAAGPRRGPACRAPWRRQLPSHRYLARQDGAVDRAALLSGPRRRASSSTASATSTARRARRSTGAGPPGYSGSGGLYRVQVDDYHDHDNDAYSFRSLEAEVRQLIPLLRANWVLALRGLATTTDIDDSSAVPYFLLPSLGGGTPARLSGLPLPRSQPAADERGGALDAGAVSGHGALLRRGQGRSRTPRDLDFNDLQDSYGIGMRLVGPKGYAFRVEVAHSREHSARLIFSAGGSILMRSHLTTTAIRRSLAAGRRPRAGIEPGRERPKFYADDPAHGSSTRRTRRACGTRDRPGLRHARELCSPGRAIGRPTSARRTSTRSTKCPTRAGSPTALGVAPLTVDDVAEGPDTGTGPAPGGWTVIAAKSDGVTPGFTIRDSAGEVWFLKFDPPGYPAMATGTEVVVTKLFWALGYHVPETHLATLRPNELAIGDAARITPPSGSRRAFERVRHRRAAAAGPSRRRRHLPRRRQQGARGQAGRPLPLLRHAPRRSERRRPARASPRAARLRHVRRVGQPRRREVDQHARHADRARTAGRSSGTTCSTSARRSAAPASTRASRSRAPNTSSRAGRRWRGCPASASTSRTGGPCRSIARDPSAPSPIDNADLGSGAVEAALSELGVPIGAAGRQVLGGTAPAGVHRRDARRRWSASASSTIRDQRRC